MRYYSLSVALVLSLAAALGCRPAAERLLAALHARLCRLARRVLARCEAAARSAAMRSAAALVRLEERCGTLPRRLRGPSWRTAVGGA